jgi:hypothetical protein
MTINIYKENSILLSIPGDNSLVTFFKNKNDIKYTIEPNTKTEGRHVLKYAFDKQEYSVSISDIMAESILNEYRTEWVDE